MPQPVHYTGPISFDFRPPAILQRPDLAAHIANISTLWNEIEARTAIFLAALLGTEAKTVITVYLALQNDGAKRAAIEAICSLKLPPEKHHEFQEIQRLIGKRYSDRNSVVHGAWGISPEYPDSLLWNDFRDSSLLYVELMELADHQQRQERLMKSQRQIMVYDKRDFVAIEKRLSAAYEKLRDFSKPYTEAAFRGGSK